MVTKVLIAEGAFKDRIGYVTNILSPNLWEIFVKPEDLCPTPELYNLLFPLRNPAPNVPLNGIKIYINRSKLRFYEVLYDHMPPTNGDTYIEEHCTLPTLEPEPTNVQPEPEVPLAEPLEARLAQLAEMDLTDEQHELLQTYPDAAGFAIIRKRNEQGVQSPYYGFRCYWTDEFPVEGVTKPFPRYLVRVIFPPDHPQNGREIWRNYFEPDLEFE